MVPLAWSTPAWPAVPEERHQRCDVEPHFCTAERRGLVVGCLPERGAPKKVAETTSYTRLGFAVPVEAQDDFVVRIAAETA